DIFSSVTAIEISPDAKDTKGLTLKDVNGDLVLDVTITTAAGLTETYINGGVADFTTGAQPIGGGGTPSRAIAVGDLDSNGFKDI
ncbi:VCBS repeat-containing protein, partial [Staphylococcus aureus]|nr:VCBS repeat-containing protein [Staphylococcus aureus]